MAEAKRVTGERKAPKLPALGPQDYKPALWNAVKKGGWTLEEAAHYAHEQIPTGEPIDVRKSDAVSQLYAWLLKEYHGEKQPDQPRLCNLPGHDDPPLFSPGDIMRYLWERHRHVSLRVWALYDTADKGEADASLAIGISRGNYERAADVIWGRYENATIAEVVNFLSTLPNALRKKDGLPYFHPMSRQYLGKILQGRSKRKPGRPKSGETCSIAGNEQHLVELIKKELGY